MTKKKPSRRRPRPRTTYELALDRAATRLSKAVDERTAALMKLDELAREIPNLENAVAGLKLLVEAKPIAPPTAMLGTPGLPHQDHPYAPQTFTPPPVATGEPAQLATQEEFLARFMPRTGPLRTSSPVPPAAPSPRPEAPPLTAQQTVGNSEDENEFLTGDGPGVDLLS